MCAPPTSVSGGYGPFETRICFDEPASAIAFGSVSTGFAIVPGKLSLPELMSTKIEFDASPSMPSQLESTKLSSGRSGIIVMSAGDWHCDQPVAPWQVRCPLHVVPVGVVMLQPVIRPALAAEQSHAMLLGTHCLAVPASPSGTSTQL